MIVIGVILQKFETVIIKGGQSSESIIGIDGSYSRIVELRSKTKIGIIGICSYKNPIREIVPDVHIKTFQCVTYCLVTYFLESSQLGQQTAQCGIGIQFRLGVIFDDGNRITSAIAPYIDPGG